MEKTAAQRALRAYLALPVFILALLMIMGGQYLMIKLEMIPRDTQEYYPVDLMALVLWQAICLLSVAYLYHRLAQSEVFGFADAIRLSDAFKAFLGWILTLLVIALLVSLLGIEVKQFDQIPAANLQSQKGMFFLLTVILAPIYEEFIFRSVLLRALVPPGSSKKMQIVGIVVTAVLFSAIHMDMDAALPIFILGCYLGYLALKRESILLPVVIHMMQNLLGITQILN